MTGLATAPGAVVVRGLTKRYGDVVALDRLDLDVPAGSIFGFLGPNGAGKTTTLRLLTGLGRPTAGTASVDGINVATGGRELARRIGSLDQDPRFYGWLTGRELLTLVGRCYGFDARQLRGRVDEVLDLIGLVEAADRRIGGYSGGMRQRLGIGQAVLPRPAVLFLDEPVSALDPAGRRDVLEFIGGLRGAMTVVMSTHILGDVERICDRVGILDRGHLVTEGPMEELLERHAQPMFEFIRSLPRLVPSRVWSRPSGRRHGSATSARSKESCGSLLPTRPPRRKPFCRWSAPPTFRSPDSSGSGRRSRTSSSGSSARTV